MGQHGQPSLDQCLRDIYDSHAAGSVEWVSSIVQALTQTISTALVRGTASAESTSHAGRTFTSDGPATARLRPLAQQVKGDLTFLPAAKVSGRWQGSKPFDQAPWVCYPDQVELYQSDRLDKYVDEALECPAKGCRKSDGLEMTQGELLKTIRQECPDIDIWVIGGFVRDVVQGKPGKDVDLAFITDDDGLKRLEACVAKQGWVHECKLDKGYLHIGDEAKRDVEGKTVRNFYVGSGVWGGGEWTCNSLFYSLEQKVIVDIMGGRCKDDAENKVLRVPFYQFLQDEDTTRDAKWQLQQWENEMGISGVYRYLKFRARGYTPADRLLLPLMICRIMVRSFASRQTFVDHMTKLVNWAQKDGEHSLDKWLGILIEEIATVVGSRALTPGTQLTLWQQGADAIACTIEAILGKGATATVYRVAYAGKTGALKVFNATHTDKDFVHLAQEASLMLRLNHPTSHPNVLPLEFVRFEPESEQLFFLLEYVDGGDLQEWIRPRIREKTGRLYQGTEAEAQTRVVQVAHDLAAGLAFAHSKGVLHEDAKPPNVLMTTEGRPMLSDMGVSAMGESVEVADGGHKVEAELRGGTYAFASAKVVKLLPQLRECRSHEEREQLKKATPLTHSDDIFAFAATVFEMFVGGGEWRAGEQRAADLWSTHGRALFSSVELRVPLPQGMDEVLAACFDSEKTPGLTMAQVVDRIGRVCEALTGEAVVAAAGSKGLSDERVVVIRNNLGLAFHDRGKPELAVEQYRAALEVNQGDARAYNNLGAALLSQGQDVEASKRFNEALEVEPNHREATYNKRLLDERHSIQQGDALLDRSGVASAMDDDGRKVDWADIAKLAPAQRLEVYRGGRWKAVTAREIQNQAGGLLALTHRLPHLANGDVTGGGHMDRATVPSFMPEQLLMVFESGAWRCKPAHELKVYTERVNYTLALFTDVEALAQAKRGYDVALCEEHASILDLFSGQHLNTRTQTATLRYRDVERAQRTLREQNDVDNEQWQRERKQSAMSPSSADANARTILHEMLGSNDDATARLRRYLLLILGPAASGKTTLLKTFAMEMVHEHPKFLPILMPVIEVIPVLETCNRASGESVVAAFIQRKHAQHAHLLLQMMLMHHAVFLIDGIDESGTYREAVQEFIKVELLEPGHKTIITSRRSGFSSDAFLQCRLVELLPLTASQQAAMVRTRVPDETRSGALVDELGTPAFKDIAGNPLMLSMMISVYISNGFVVISNRSELYERALRTLMGRSDKGRAGLEGVEQEALLAHLQRLASGSHERQGERRIFKKAEGIKWAGEDGWAAIEKAMGEGRLPILVNIGANFWGTPEYRFGHLSYQEYLTGREYYQKLIASQFAKSVVEELLGRPPSDAFAEVKQHVVLQLLAGVFSPSQLSTFSAVLFGGSLEPQKLPATTTSHPSHLGFFATKRGGIVPRWRRRYFSYNIDAREITYWVSKEAASTGNSTQGRKGVIRMRDVQQKGDKLKIMDVSGRVYSLKKVDETGKQLEQRFRAAAAKVVDTARVRGGDTLRFEKRLGPAGAEALAPYLRANTSLRVLVLRHTYLGTDGMKTLANALEVNTMLTELDVTKNGIDAEGAKAISAHIRSVTCGV